MNTPDRSVSQLLQAYRRGEEEAGNQLLKRFEPWLQLLARTQMESQLRAKFDPSDVVQHALLEAVRSFAQFRGRTEAEFGGWLRQILAHALAHEIRRYRGTHKRDVNREISWDEELTRTARRLEDLVAASATSPSQRLVNEERAVLLASTLDRLPADYREVLILRNLEGLSHQEVARRMGRNPGAVRMLWIRALARLQEELQQSCSHAG